MRALLIILAVLVIALVLWAAYRVAARRAATAASAERYRVLETTGAGHAHVYVSRGTPDSAVLIGSVNLNEDDFDERYAALVIQAADRVATLNASRQLHAEG